MIVNPQLFNYRLIIGALVIAFVVFGSIGISSYNTLKNQEAIAEQEFNLVQRELSQMITLYDEVGVENEERALQLQQSKSRMQSLLDSLEIVKSNLPLITKYKQEALAMKQKQNWFISEVNSTKKEIENLKNQTEKDSELIAIQHIQLALLANENKKLSNVVKEITALKAKNVEATALKTSRRNADVETSRADEANNFEVCFTIEENTFSPKGNKDIYVQITDPNHNVVSDRGAVKFGKTSLIYSGKTSVNYRNTNLDVCTKINIKSEVQLKKGDYIISVFHDNEILGTSKIFLN